MPTRASRPSGARWAWSMTSAGRSSNASSAPSIASWRGSAGDGSGPAEPTEAWCERVLGGAPLGRELSAMELLRGPGVRYDDLLELIGRRRSCAAGGPAGRRIDAQLRLALEVRARYSGYIERAQEEIERARRNEHTALPSDLDYGQLAGLSNEVRQKLGEIRPATLGQAARVPA